MSTHKPLVLVPACNRLLGEHPFHIVGKKYIDFVRLAGCMPWVVPAATPQELDELLAQAHGVLLTGSPSNVHPEHFNEDVLDANLPLDPVRDGWTLPLVPRALRLGLPLFAICRGFQEMNVALGGSLHQAVQTLPGMLDHRADEALRAEQAYAEAHALHIEPGGLMAALLGTASLCVNSLHGQGVNTLAPGLRVEARAPDGLVEAFSVEGGSSFALGVQWHPEWQAERQPASMRLLGAFGAACRDYRDKVRQPRHDFIRDPDT